MATVPAQFILIVLHIFRLYTDLETCYGTLRLIPASTVLILTDSITISNIL